MNSESRPKVVLMLVLMLALLGLGGLVGGAGLLAAADGSVLQMPVEMLEGSPFINYLLPGLLLFFLNGIYPLLAAYSVLRKPGWSWPNKLNPFKKMHWWWAAALAAGVILIIWITVQMALVGYVHPIQPFYLVWGLAILLLVFLPGVRQDARLPGRRERLARLPSEEPRRQMPGRRSQVGRSGKKHKKS